MIYRSINSLAALFILAMTLFANVSKAETVSDSVLGFTLNLPIGFTPRVDLIGVTPDVFHAFEFGEAKDGEVAVVLLIETMRGTIGRERLGPQDMPPGFAGKMFTINWREFEIDGFEVPEEINGTKTITYNVQVPLKRSAVQIKLFGPVDRESELKGLLKAVLDGMQGESNWLSSNLPKSAANSGQYGTVLLCLAGAGVLAGVAILWFVSRRTPKGTVLVLAAVIYATSWTMDHIRVREVRMLCGSMRLLGFVGLILGVADLRRNRSCNQPVQITAQPRGKISDEPVDE